MNKQQIIEDFEVNKMNELQTKKAILKRIQNGDFEKKEQTFFEAGECVVLDISEILSNYDGTFSTLTSNGFEGVFTKNAILDHITL